MEDIKKTTESMAHHLKIVKKMDKSVSSLGASDKRQLQESLNQLFSLNVDIFEYLLQVAKDNN